MGTCAKCGKRINEVVAEPIVIAWGSEQTAGYAFRCPDDECAAIFNIETLDSDPNG